MARTARIERKTTETDIVIELNLDGNGSAAIETGIGFLDHMLTLFARHGLFDLTITASGDLNVDDHHTVEDVGLCLGEAFIKALGDMKGITRYGLGVCPMDEALASVAVDVSNRPFLKYDIQTAEPEIGGLSIQLFEEFFRAFSIRASVTLHILLKYGVNGHHIFESVFKSWARAMAEAVSMRPRLKDVPSTKGTL